MEKNIQISDYGYQLPFSRIAKFPVTPRDYSKLLIYRHGEITEGHFYDLPDLIPQDSLMVFNNTRVIQARIYFHKPTGGRIEVFLLEPDTPAAYDMAFQARSSCVWHCLIGNQKKWKEEELVREFSINGTQYLLIATRVGQQDNSQLVRLSWKPAAESTPSPIAQQPTFADIIEAVGQLPIPPYLNRDTQDSDNTTYQTVYSRIKGSVAAPTAGLHFTPDVLQAIDKRHIIREEITLHVGAGTFKPVKSDTIGEHEMHSEHFSVSQQTIDRLIQHNAQAIAVGTTSVRTLESLYYIGWKIFNNPAIDEQELCVSQWEPYQHPSPAIQPPTPIQALQAIREWLTRNQLDKLTSSTKIIIVPGYKYRIVNQLVTNFHQPHSTLLLLVSAFVGEKWRDIYQYALQHDFRFLSYGDSSLIIP